MTGISDLSNELLALIVVHITKPSDKLHFALLSKQYHERIVPLVYKEITLDFSQYRIPQLSRHTVLDHCEKTSRLLVPQAPCSNFVRLAEKLSLSSGSQTQGTLPHHVKTLALKLQANNEANVIETALCKALLVLPHLTQLHFNLVEQGQDGEPEIFSLAPFARALAPMSGTLRSLSIYLASRKVSTEMSYFFHGCSHGWTVGSLHHFSVLENFSIQMGSLLGRDGHEIIHADLNALLPQNLKHFRIYWPDIWPEFVDLVLTLWLTNPVQPTLQTVTVQDVRKGQPSVADLEEKLDYIRGFPQLSRPEVDLRVEQRLDFCWK